MKLSRLHLTALLLALLSATLAGGEPAGFRVIVHPSNPASSIAREELSRIFLRKQLAWRYGEAALPVDRQMSSPVREVFTLQVHRRSMRTVSSYWQQQVFSGRSAPPPERRSDTSVMEYVAENPGAVGYVRSDAKLEGVKLLQVHE
jgi:ABC-type phosphate transport system substrate-binding protein